MNGLPDFGISMTPSVEGSSVVRRLEPRAKLRAHMDNVVVRILPREDVSKGGIHIPANAHGPNAKQTVLAEVVASGPGWRMRNGRGPLVPNESKPGDVVLIDALAGQDYSYDLNVPRHNKDAGWADDRGQFRIVREDEIHCVVEEW